MGKIENVVERFTVQTCVYWGTPVIDDDEGWTFAAPVELSPDNANGGCRWDEKQELKIGFDGNTFSSQAIVLVNIDLDRRGYLYNGTIAEIEAAGYTKTKPLEIPTAFIIQQFEKIPMVRQTDDFVRTAYLYDQG